MKTRQAGAAILTAMLTVALVAVMTSAMLWQAWRGLEVESAQRTRVQSTWILNGALDWARLILREDARQGGADGLSEPWSVPLAPARLSDFLATERGQNLVSDETDPSQEAFLSGAIQDMQARLNVHNLLEGKKLNMAGVAAWMRLFEQLNLPEAELLRLTNSLMAASANGPLSAGENRPLWPQDVSDLRWLGLSAPSLAALSPYITLLPANTPINLNTASPEVLLAGIDGMDLAQARALVRVRASKRFNTLADVAKLIDNPGIKLEPKLHSTSSRYFSVMGQLRVGQTTVQERSLIQRDGLQVLALRRTREIVNLTMQSVLRDQPANAPPLQ